MNRFAIRETFDQWMARVDAHVQARAGCSVHDLADCCFRDWYDDDMHPLVAARKAIRSQDGDDDE